MLRDIKVKKIRQKFMDEKIVDIADYINQAVSRSDLKNRVKDGDRVGITVGSRGIANLKLIVKSLVDELKKLNVKPFIIPAMGSHGGATAEGQREVLISYGINEEELGVPIISSTDVVKIGEIKDGQTVFFSKDALNADGIIALNRIKVHTDINSDTFGSGMSKILAIGLGKPKGASYIHSFGCYGLRELIPQAAELIIKKAPIIQGVGILENSYDETMRIEFVSPENIRSTDIRLLGESKELLPTFPVDDLDVLVLEEMGKDISGTGMDTNVIGRLEINGEVDFAKPDIKRIVVFDLTDNSHGNALGVGLADIISRELYEKINFDTTYANIITSTFLNRGKIPIIMETEKAAIKLAIKTSWVQEDIQTRLILAKNTLELEHFYVSESIWNEIKDKENIEECSDWENLNFDIDGRLKLKI